MSCSKHCIIFSSTWWFYTDTIERVLRDGDIDRALQAVGELLDADGERVGVVLIGGAALLLHGVIDRATRDVDVVAFGTTDGDATSLFRPPDPLPRALATAIAQVARDFGLPSDWMNRGPANQWDIGLPPGFADRIEWRRYAGLDVGLAHRLDLIFFKLEAAADQPTSDSRHFRDLVALEPTDDELHRAATWARTVNASTIFHDVLDRVIAHVARTRRSSGD